MIVGARSRADDTFRLMDVVVGFGVLLRTGFGHIGRAFSIYMFLLVFY